MLEALKKTGFEKCEFGPDSDSCVYCGKTQVYLYWRSVDYFSQDGEYFCLACVIEEYETNEKVLTQYGLNEKGVKNVISLPEM